MMTYGELLKLVAAVHTPADARVLFDRLVADNVALGKSESEAGAIVRSNIGFCFGEGVLTLEQRKMWATTVGAQHPALPQLSERDATAREALLAGIRLGEAQKARRDRSD